MDLFLMQNSWSFTYLAVFILAIARHKKPIHYKVHLSILILSFSCNLMPSSMELIETVKNLSSVFYISCLLSLYTILPCCGFFFNNLELIQAIVTRQYKKYPAYLNICFYVLTCFCSFMVTFHYVYRHYRFILPF